MKTYDQLREEGYVQYLVMLSKGTYEGSSVPQIVFYYLTKEEKTPTQVADAFKEAFNEYVKEFNECENTNYSIIECFNYLFKMEWHEAAEFEYLMTKGWDNNPYLHIPIKKVVVLQGMEDYCRENPEGWLFNNRNPNNSVSSEIFYQFDVVKPETR